MTLMLDLNRIITQLMRNRITLKHTQYLKEKIVSRFQFLLTLVEAFNLIMDWVLHPKLISKPEKLQT